ncbi:hypothetical protein PAXINDRAFT_15638 [Paxillus involutus ATCC 200175]|uniref:Uncharacterized protein n=1 Tax=Paxillus involutus ATCC 200175 TaxID=664439 RepID=A0A0C9TUV4_PAXIN|nr:hypothetical protein PAXINDRAFT_15638 [Paxillus involutus ATCC 200175]
MFVRAVEDVSMESNSDYSNSVRNSALLSSTVLHGSGHLGPYLQKATEYFARSDSD